MPDGSQHTASQEINAREEGGEFVAGALGAGGAHPMRTPQERQARAAAAAAAEAGDEEAGQVASTRVPHNLSSSTWACSAMCINLHSWP